MKISAKFNIRDLWVGVNWYTDAFGTNVWICLIPCVPILVQMKASERP